VTFVTGFRAHDVRYKETDFRRRKVFASASSRALGKFPQQIFVGAPEEIGLHIGKAEPVSRIRFASDISIPGMLAVTAAPCAGRACS